MAVCFFDDNYDESYECDYTVKKYNIEVIVNYEIDKEIEPDNNGVKSFGLNTKFKDRDILIIDYKNKKNVLLKDAYYCGHTMCGEPQMAVQKQNLVLDIIFVIKIMINCAT